MSMFDRRKAAILADLQSEDPDLSPKGRPDDGIIELLALLNAHPDFVSTSSCSGRAVVFLDADKTSSDEAARGRWLMNRHAPLDDGVEGLNLEQLNAILFADTEVAGHGTLTEGPRRLVTLKFEPLILHVLCRNITAASSLLHVATVSGYRESGIAISGAATSQEKIIVAIRTNSIRLDVPLGVYNAHTGYIHMFGLGAEYLHSLLQLVKVKFDENESRKENLVKALQHAFNATESQSPAETKEERRLRKREEGLRLQELKNQKQTTDYEEKKIIDALNDDLPLGSPATL